MSAAALSGASLTYVQEQFAATLHAVDDAVHFAFRRRLRDQEYEEKLAEARAAAWGAWAGLLRRGKDPVAVGVHGIANNAVRYVRNGRRMGCGTAGRGARDVYHRRAQQRDGFRLVSLDSGDAVAAELSAPDGWREWLAEDHRVGPADEACFRVDFGEWLESLPARKRIIAERLTEGYDGVTVARMAGVSPGRVCQVRSELEASWESFQGQPECGPHRPDVTTS